MIKKIAFVLIALVSVVYSISYLSFSNELNERKIDKLKSKYFIPGVAVAFIHKDKVEHFYLGYSDIKNKKKVSSETIFQLGSIAKPLSALVSLKVINKHGYALDDSVEKIIPIDVSHPDQLTFERLLSHTSGLNYLISNGALSKEDSSKRLSLNQLKTFSNKNKKFLYTAAGYYLVQLALENLEKKDISNLLQKNILTPLDLNNSSFDNLNSKYCAKGYSLFGKVFPEAYYHEKTVGALTSNLEDMSKFVESFWNGELKKNIGIKQYNQIYELNKNEYNLGFAVKEYNKCKYLSHHGTNRGWNAYFGFFTDKKEGLVILTNSDWGLSFIDHLQKLWLRNVIEKKQFYAFTLANLSVDFSIGLISILLLLIYFKWKPKKRLSRIQLSALIIFLTAWYFIFYSPYIVIPGWVIAPYFPWRFQYLSLLISLSCLSLILKPYIIRIGKGPITSLEK